MEPSALAEDPVVSARSAGLRYVSDARPGIRRQRRGKGFRYVGPDGQPVRDEATLARIKSLAIPPAWQQVWICPIPNGHLQATGRDAKGRKQSRYHPRWREVRDETKYGRMMAFAQALPAIRERVSRDLAAPGLPREKVLATIVRLLETTFIRVGNQEYARKNKSYGLTTMRNRQVEIRGGNICFQFRGKSGVQHTVRLTDRRLARILARCRDLPGYELFQYLDGEGNTHSVDSADVNAYLGEITGQHFTAKDFRTWAGTVLACAALRDMEAFASQTQAKRNLVRAIAQVAARLGNTPAVCRKCYVHPTVLESYLAGEMLSPFEDMVERQIDEQETDLRAEERALLHLLRKRAASESISKAS
jgi:DNA topoisomerase-1